MNEVKMKPEKPLGHRSYGSIPHLIGSNRGPADKGVNEGQHRICTENARSGDVIIVQEKLDGTNVSIAKIDGQIVPLIRAGYRAESSHHEQHHLFADWVNERQGSFDYLLRDGERLCGEWLAQAHGTRYCISQVTPFVAFDIMRCHERIGHHAFLERTKWCQDSGLFDVPPLIHWGGPLPINKALEMLCQKGHYGATELCEGVVYRVENHLRFDFLAKYVRPEFTPGKYLDREVWNWRPPS